MLNFILLQNSIAARNLNACNISRRALRLTQGAGFADRIRRANAIYAGVFGGCRARRQDNAAFCDRRKSPKRRYWLARQRLAERERQSRIFVLCRAERYARRCAASVGEYIFCDDYAGILDIKISAKDAIEGFFALYENKIPWKQIFRNFSLQFQKSQKFSVHLGGEKISLAQAKLCEDGSIIINEERVYALR